MDRNLSLYIVWLQLNIKYMLQKNISFEDFEKNSAAYKGSIKYFISLLLVIIYDIHPELREYKISEHYDKSSYYRFYAAWEDKLCRFTAEHCLYMIDDINAILEGEAEKWIKYHEENNTQPPSLQLKQ